MNEFIHPVEHAESKRLRAATAFGKNRGLARKPVQELEGARRRVFAVAIHDQDGVARNGLFDMDEANGDSSLVAEITAQAKNSDLLDR